MAHVPPVMIRRRASGLAYRTISVGFLLGILLSAVSPPSPAYADYVGTAVNRIFIDPEGVSDILDGYDIGDEVSYIVETTPADTGSTVGLGSWSTVYIPSGVVVIGAELVASDGDGTYSAIPAEDVTAAADDCGPRGCKFPTSGTLQNGRINEVQQDTGIFFSTDSQTALAAPQIIETTGSSAAGDQNVYNQWDYNQILAFGSNTPTALSGNGGTGNTPVVSILGTWFGTGSPVAGADTYYTNDYDPDCDTGSDFEADLGCTGPWQRIKYDNAKIGGSGAIVPATTSTDPPLNTAVLTSAGHDFSVDGALPASTNTVRTVLGERRLGDLETARIALRITDPAAFTLSFSNDTFCIDATGGDTDKPGRGPQDNNWRYYEGNNHVCLDWSINAVVLKQAKFVNGVASSGGNLSPGDVVGYEFTFYNTTNDILYDINLSDTPSTANLTLVAAGTSGCPYSSYDGTQSGQPTFFGITGNTANWNELGSLAAGSSVTVFLCAQVDSGASFGDEVRNEAFAAFALTDGGAQQGPISSTTLGVISTQIAGTVYEDLDGSGPPSSGDIGIEGVTVQLYLDDGTDAGELDAGDTLVASVTTNPAGGYEFNGYDPANYLVVETDPSGYSSIADIDTAVGDCALPSPENGCNVIGRIILTASSSSLGNDFFDTQPGSIGDFVWDDLDGDGIQDGGEPGLENVTVDLYRDNNNDGVIDGGDTLLGTDTTDASGNYDFTNVPLGNYLVTVTDTLGVLTGFALTGGTDPTDVTLSSGQDFNDADFGYQSIPTPTETPIPTSTPTATPSNTPLPTSTPTDTPIPTSTPIDTSTPAPTNTPTETPTPTGMPTATPTDTPVLTITPTPTNTSSVTVIDPALTKSGSPTAARIGDAVVFLIEVFNNGNTPADNVQLTDVIPPFLDISSVEVVPAGPTVSIIGQTITVDFGTVDPAESWIVTVTTIINSSATPLGGTNDVTLTTDSVDDDPDNNFDSVTITIFVTIPETGFAPSEITELPRQPVSKAYRSYSDMWLEIPSLGVETEIVGVPLLEDGWDVRWLWDRAGYLNGTAFPTWSGNSVITGHVSLPNGQAGPFASLLDIRFGEQVIVHAWGFRYVYEIRSLEYVAPDDESVFSHQDLSWVTLVTCHSYDETVNAYRLRVSAGAVLVAIEDDNTAAHYPQQVVVRTRGVQDN